jgi:hypothetical protein
MIGEAPRTEEAKRSFDWPDANIHVPYDSPDIGRIVADLIAPLNDCERLGEIMFGRTGVAASNSGGV